MHAVGTRDVEPEPAFFDPTGAGSGLSLKRAFFNCREYLFGKYVECTLCRNNVERIKTLWYCTYFRPEGTPGDPCMEQFSEKTRYRKH